MTLQNCIDFFKFLLVSIGWAFLAFFGKLILAIVLIVIGIDLSDKITYSTNELEVSETWSLFHILVVFLENVFVVYGLSLISSKYAKNRLSFKSQIAILSIIFSGLHFQRGIGVVILILPLSIVMYFLTLKDFKKSYKVAFFKPLMVHWMFNAISIVFSAAILHFSQNF